MSKCRSCSTEIFWDWVDTWASGKPKPKDVIGVVIVRGTRTLQTADKPHRCPNDTYAMRRLRDFKISDKHLNFATLKPISTERDDLSDAAEFYF